jgi:UDP-2,4-diacetamido-2,4,6-trideoxy-beta-L-altropyranose hydrolase
VIRADADSTVGVGHVMRCLALAQAWIRRGGSAGFICARLPQTLRRRIVAEGCELILLGPVRPGSQHDLESTRRALGALRADCVVLDGYHFGSPYHLTLKETSIKLAAIDDDGRLPWYADDFVLNQNLHADEALYGQRAPSTRLLLGTHFVLLRREFLCCRTARETAPRGRRILVTMGGSDAHNATRNVIESLAEIRTVQLELDVVIGPGNRHAKELRSAAARQTHRVRLLEHPVDLPRLMAQADLAITAGGSTCWELAFLGVPHAILILADNQAPIAENLARVGGQLCLGRRDALGRREWIDAVAALLDDPARREAMSRQGMCLVDGRGADRVACALRGAA